MRLPVAFASPSPMSNAVNVLPEPGGPYMPILRAACSAFAFLNGAAPPMFFASCLLSLCFFFLVQFPTHMPRKLIYLISVAGMIERLKTADMKRLAAVLAPHGIVYLPAADVALGH